MSNLRQLEGVWLTFPVGDVLTFILISCLLIPRIRVLRQKRATENAVAGLETAAES